MLNLLRWQSRCTNFQDWNFIYLWLYNYTFQRATILIYKTSIRLCRKSTNKLFPLFAIKNATSIPSFPRVSSRGREAWCKRDRYLIHTQVKTIYVRRRGGRKKKKSYTHQLLASEDFLMFFPRLPHSSPFATSSLFANSPEVWPLFHPLIGKSAVPHAKDACPASQPAIFYSLPVPTAGWNMNPL